MPYLGLHSTLYHIGIFLQGYNIISSGSSFELGIPQRYNYEKHIPWMYSGNSATCLFYRVVWIILKWQYIRLYSYFILQWYRYIKYRYKHKVSIVFLSYKAIELSLVIISIPSQYINIIHQYTNQPSCSQY
jgi:hypothetical protein